jgi:hypothetical protein
MDEAKQKETELERIKTNVRRAYDYFKPNYDRFNDFRRFIFESSLTSDEITLLATIGKPQLEFNVLEAYISRLLGEFSKQEPDIEVNADNPDKADPLMIRIIEMHLRHTLGDSNNNHTRYEVYKDVLSGGFSTLKVEVDYPTPKSMHQVISIVRAFDPTLCGFDQLARESHKGDGRFCFELYPMSKEDFMDRYPDVPIENINFRRDFSGFNWAYLNDATPIVVIADYYEKKKRDIELVQLQDGAVLEHKDYKKMVKEWEDFTQPPAIIGKPRKSQIDEIVRYRLIENQVIEYKETDFEMLPLIFVDGSSAIIKTPKNGNVRQYTRPYVYHARGAQRLKNYAGICWANEIENTIQHKFIVAKEALPKEEEFMQAYKDVQKASVVVFNSVHEGDPNLPINEPIRELQRNPMPPEIAQAFTGADSLIQNVLGSYDASLGINNNQLSGVALVEAASQSNATAMPYIVGFLQGYQRAAQCYVNLMPKYYVTPRTLPIVDHEGRKGYVKINQQDGLDMDYDANEFNVILKAGASFQVQKARTIQMVQEICSMSPLMAQFMAEKGLNFILDNMEGRGIEQLKQMVDGWMKEMQSQKQMAMQAQQQEMQNNPAAMKAQNDAQKLQLEAQKQQQDFQVDMAQLQFQEKKLSADMKMEEEDQKIRLIAEETERYAKGIQLKIAHMDMEHKHKHDGISAALELKDMKHNHTHDGINALLEHKDMKHRHAKETAEFHHMKTEASKPKIEHRSSNH